MHMVGDPYGNPYMQAYAQASPYPMNGNGNGDYMNGSITNYDQTYMQQEEEWEREGLLDPLWEKQQRKVTLAFNITTFSLFFLFLGYKSLKFVFEIHNNIKDDIK